MAQYKVQLKGTVTRKSLKRALREGFVECKLFDIVHVNARIKDGDPVAEAIKKTGEFALVDDENLVTEVERVYETRWDCLIAPEGVRQAA